MKWPAKLGFMAITWMKWKARSQNTRRRWKRSVSIIIRTEIQFAAVSMILYLSWQGKKIAEKFWCNFFSCHFFPMKILYTYIISLFFITFITNHLYIESANRKGYKSIDRFILLRFHPNGLSIVFGSVSTSFLLYFLIGYLFR